MKISYIGRHALFHDRIYRSGLTFQKGVPKDVPALLAEKLLRHRDVFVAAEAGKGAAKRAEAKTDAETLDAIQRNESAAKAEEADEHVLANVKDEIALMDKTALERFARERFRQEIDRRKSLVELRQQVSEMIDIYGMA